MSRTDVQKLKISILIPCHNEELGIRQCIQSCLNQTRKPDQILVVNDGSTDGSAAVLKEFGDAIEGVTLPRATGNKSFAQEKGLKFITGDAFIATDGDTLLDERFVELIEKDLEDPEVAAVSGYVVSRKYNWLTACRELDYVIGQDLHKVAQSNINFLFVIPGCAGVFRTKLFKKFINFDHDTLTEDLDFTYRLHKQCLTIKYNRQARAYTQDPVTLGAYINQMRRWYAGGWQNLIKHFGVVNRPTNALELSLMYIEGLIFSAALFIFPIINLNFFKFFIAPYFLFMLIIGTYAAFARKRPDLIIYAPFYVLLVFVNSYIFLEQFVKEIIFRNSNRVWFKPERVAYD